MTHIAASLFTPPATDVAALHRLAEEINGAWQRASGFAVCESCGPENKFRITIDYPTLEKAQDAYRAMHDITDILRRHLGQPQPQVEPTPWHTLLAKSAALGDFAIGFIEGDLNRPTATIGYYSDSPIHCYDLDENWLPAETPDRREALESRIAECVRDMHNGGHSIAPSEASLHREGRSKPLGEAFQAGAEDWARLTGDERSDDPVLQAWRRASDQWRAERESLLEKLARVLAHCQQYRTSANEPGRQSLAVEVIRIIEGE